MRDKRRLRLLAIVLLYILIIVLIAAGWSFFGKRPGWENDRGRVMKEILKTPDEGILYYYLGRIGFKEKKYNEAIGSLENALARKLSPEGRTLAYHELGNCYYEKNKMDKAITYYRKALVITADHAPSLDSLGRAYFRRQEFDTARQYFEKAVSEQPGSDAFNRNLAGAYLMLDDRIKACEYWRRALKINPDQPEVREFLEKYE